MRRVEDINNLENKRNKHANNQRSRSLLAYSSFLALIPLSYAMGAIVGSAALLAVAPLLPAIGTGIAIGLGAIAIGAGVMAGVSAVKKNLANRNINRIQKQNQMQGNGQSQGYELNQTTQRQLRPTEMNRMEKPLASPRQGARQIATPTATATATPTIGPRSIRM